MKTAIYIQDSEVQVVLTPESDNEKSALNMLEAGQSCKILKGSFFESRGGYFRGGFEDQGYSADQSTILRLETKKDGK